MHYDFHAGFEFLAYFSLGMTINLSITNASRKHYWIAVTTFIIFGFLAAIGVGK